MAGGLWYRQGGHEVTQRSALTLVEVEGRGVEGGDHNAVAGVDRPQQVQLGGDDRARDRDLSVPVGLDTVEGLVLDLPCVEQLALRIALEGLLEIALIGGRAGE